MAELCGMLEREAGAECERMLGDARAEAERIGREADARRADERTRALSAEETMVRAAAESRLASARRAARRRTLEGQRRLVDRVLATAALLLPAAAARPDVLGRLIDDALTYADGPTILRCPPALAGATRARVADREDVTVEVAADARSGATAIVRGGAVIVDATLEGRLELAAAELAIEIRRKVDDVG
jgi:vacuolar-type H+-ATPase subunit E/Vma4